MSTFESSSMASRIACRSLYAHRALTPSHRNPISFTRHQSTTQQSTAQTSTQAQQAQQSPPPQIQRHPSSVSHPALRNQTTQRNTDNAILYIFGGLLLAGMPFSYWYWGYRERAMKAKKEEMLRGIQERYAARHGGG